MASIAGLLMLFKDVPTVLNVLTKLGELIDNLLKNSSDKKVQKYLADLEAADEKLVHAITSQQKSDSNLDFVDLIRRL